MLISIVLRWSRIEGLKLLGGDPVVYLSMRLWRPFIKESFREVVAPSRMSNMKSEDVTIYSRLASFEGIIREGKAGD